MYEHSLDREALHLVRLGLMQRRSRYIVQETMTKGLRPRFEAANCGEDPLQAVRIGSYESAGARI